MIVIPQHCVDAAASPQTANYFGAGRRIPAFVRDVIARQSDDIGFQAIGGIDRAAKLGG